jgi:hypothetical protein
MTESDRYRLVCPACTTRLQAAGKRVDDTVSVIRSALWKNEVDAFPPIVIPNKIGQEK